MKTFMAKKQTKKKKKTEGGPAAKTAMSQEWEILQFSGNSGFLRNQPPNT